KRRVTVAQQVARHGLPGKGLGHLAREPGLRRILGDVEVNDPSSIMAEEDQGVEKPKCRSCDDEHVDRDNVVHVVLQKGAPGRRGDFGAPRQISPDRGLADFNTKLEQFTSSCGSATWPVA